ncbi:SUB8 [Candida metapsilosis]|uniref:SUB8 n=1 Tax=Candida metapsilosis TaxID=273372 RepID=A0A8H7ZC52_9ASCO|nr:SUB8 [Candida metapsilosis]
MQPTSVAALLSLFVTLTCGFVLPDFNLILESFNKLLPGNYHESVPAEPTFEEYKTNLINLNKAVPHHYVVIFKDDLSQSQMEQYKQWLQVEYTNMLSIVEEAPREVQVLKKLEFFNIEGFFGGFTGFFTAGVIEKIKKDPHVKLVEPDAIFKINEFDIQKDAPWGISRVSHREGGDERKYYYDNEAGKGVTAYVIDTGIKVEHDEFEGRAQWGDAIAFPKVKIDGHGHGTHCAGIIGAKTYGIAKKVELVAVGVMNLLGSGTTSDIIKGVEYVVNSHQDAVKKGKKGFKGSVVNMSIGGGISEALDLAVNAAIKAGLHVAVAAGNDDADACQYSPARAVGPITVGASNVGDAKASFSNWGKCVDVFAPGEAIESTFIWSDSAEMSGTSMASPHIAGLLSYFLSLQPEQSSEYFTGLIEPAVLKKKLIQYGTKGVLTGLDATTPNILAYNGAGGNLTDFWNI